MILLLFPGTNLSFYGLQTASQLDAGRVRPLSRKYGTYKTVKATYKTVTYMTVTYKTIKVLEKTTSRVAGSPFVQDLIAQVP